MNRQFVMGRMAPLPLTERPCWPGIGLNHPLPPRFTATLTPTSTSLAWLKKVVNHKKKMIKKL